MIESINHKALRQYFEGRKGAKIKPKHRAKIHFILAVLHSATTLKDINLPSLGLHQLGGNKRGYHAVKVDGNWRIIFQFTKGKVFNVDYLDYH